MARIRWLRLRRYLANKLETLSINFARSDLKFGKFANRLSVKFTGADFVFGRLILLGDAVLNLTNRYSGAKFTVKFGFDLGFLSAFKYILQQ